MPTGIYEKDGHWWASYTGASGKRVRRTTGIPVSSGKAGEKEAEALRGKWVAEAHQEKMWGKAPEQAAPTFTFDQVLLQYQKDRAGKQRSGAARIRATAKLLYPAFTGKAVADCDVKAWIRDMEAAGKAPGTINKALMMLSAACNYCRDELGWDVPNPAAKRKLREPEARVRWLEPEEAERLVRAADSSPKAPWLGDYVALSLNTGCRAGELLALEWSRVDLRAGQFFLEGHHTKSGKRRTIPLNAMARAAMLSRASFRASNCPDSPWVFCKEDGSRLASVKRSFATALKKAGIRDFRQHDQRHAAAVFMLRGGATLPEIREALGHSTVKVTEKYAHVSPDQVRETMDRIMVASRSGHDGSGLHNEKRRKPLV